MVRVKVYYYFKTISGLLVPTEGIVRIFNENIGKGSFSENFGALLDTPGFQIIQDCEIIVSLYSK